MRCYLSLISLIVNEELLLSWRYTNSCFNDIIFHFISKFISLMCLWFHSNNSRRSFLFDQNSLSVEITQKVSSKRMSPIESSEEHLFSLSEVRSRNNG